MRHSELYQFRRSTLESYIEQMIALLDGIDGDSDTEADGDELDQSYSEDGQLGLVHSLEDDEDGADDEPEEAEGDNDEDLEDDELEGVDEREPPFANVGLTP